MVGSVTTLVSSPSIRIEWATTYVIRHLRLNAADHFQALGATPFSYLSTLAQFDIGNFDRAGPVGHLELPQGQGPLQYAHPVPLLTPLILIPKLCHNIHVASVYYHVSMLSKTAIPTDVLYPLPVCKPLQPLHNNNHSQIIELTHYFYILFS